MFKKKKDLNQMIVEKLEEIFVEYKKKIDDYADKKENELRENWRWTSERYREISSEEMLDKIIERINRKQLK